MLDPRQDQALQELARSIARSVDALGRPCTAQLLGRIALGLVDDSESTEPTTLSSRAGTTSNLTWGEFPGRGKHHHAGPNSPARNPAPRRQNKP